MRHDTTHTGPAVLRYSLMERRISLGGIVSSICLPLLGLVCEAIGAGLPRCAAPGAEAPAPQSTRPRFGQGQGSDAKSCK